MHSPTLSIFHFLFWINLTKWPFLASIFQKFSTKKLLDENKRVLRGFVKLLIIRRLWRFCGKRRSLRKKSQRLLKIWRWLLKIWRAYGNAKSSKIWAKNVHKSRVRVQIIAFCAPIFHRSTAPQGSKTAIFHSKLRRRREQISLWKNLTNRSVCKVETTLTQLGLH